MNTFILKNGFAIGFEGKNKLFFKNKEMAKYALGLARIIYKDTWEGWVKKCYRVNKNIPEYRFIRKKYLYQNIWKFKKHWENLK